MLYVVEAAPDNVVVDPYRVGSPDFVVGDDFAHMWCSALAHCRRRFEGQTPRYKKEPSGRIGCFTPDSSPVFDMFRENCHVIADSNHGFKMIGVGKLVAEELTGDASTLLEPFRLSRYGKARCIWCPKAHSRGADALIVKWRPPFPRTPRRRHVVDVP